MSILYEALKKAEKDPKKVRTKAERDKDFVTAVRRLEETQQRAIHEHISVVKPRERSDAVFIGVLAVAVLCIVALIGVVSVSLYQQYFVSTSPAPVGDVGHSVVDSAPTPVPQKAVAPKVVSFRDETSVSSRAERSVARDVVARPVRALVVPTTPQIGGIPAAPVTPKPDFICSGIILAPEGNMCVINGEIKYVGESIDGARIDDITDDTVVLSRAGKVIRVPLILSS